MTGKKRRPSTEPMYSGGNRRDFPITRGYDSVDYIDFIASHLLNSQDILICQDFNNGHFSGCFAPSKLYSPRPIVSLWIERNFDSFLKSINKYDRVNGLLVQIYSFACDENLGFAAFFMANYGTAQAIVTNLNDVKKKWEDGFKITSSAARGSTFYIVMTKDTKEYQYKGQMCASFNTWKDTYDTIDEWYKAGYTLTGICYCTGRRQYFVAMTMIPEVQSSQYFDDTAVALNWVEEQHHVGYHPTLIFNIPTLNNKTLVVMTTDGNRSSYEYKFGYKLE